MLSLNVYAKATYKPANRPMRTKAAHAALAGSFASVPAAQDFTTALFQAYANHTPPPLFCLEF